MRRYVSYFVLLGAKGLSRLFYKLDSGWVGETAAERWDGIRIVALLNHTSLYEPLFAGAVPNRLLWQVARRCLVPGAEKTLRRPLVGRFFKLMFTDLVPITRKRDHTWTSVLRTIGPQSIVFIAPEGRMKRPTGLDLDGNPMTVRGGIADILEVIPSGRMLLVYSGGLHHVQAPGQMIPNLFKKVQVRFESLDIAAYREALGAGNGSEAFRKAVIADLERRRDLYCRVGTDSTEGS